MLLIYLGIRVESLSLGSMTVEQIVDYVMTGK